MALLNIALQSYQLTGWLGQASELVTLKGLMGFENNFNGIYFHHHFYLKTGVSRNGLSPDYSEQDTGTPPLTRFFGPGKNRVK